MDEINTPKLMGLKKDARKLARAIYKEVKNKTSKLDWMTNEDMKTRIIEQTKESVKNDKLPEGYDLRNIIPKAYPKEEDAQLWYKTFENEYSMLKEKDEL